MPKYVESAWTHDLEPDVAHGFAHQQSTRKVEFHPGEYEGKAVFENLEQGARRVVAAPLQFNEPCRFALDVDEVDCAAAIGKASYSRRHGTLIEPAGHGLARRQIGDRFLQ